MVEKTQTNQTNAKTYFNVGRSHDNEHKSSDCGYCKKPDKGHKSWGITCPKMTTTDYEKLMFRGWRRCGTYYYKWDMEQSCCQPYVIRSSIDEFQPSKSQKQDLRKFNRFLKG